MLLALVPCDPEEDVRFEPHMQVPQEWQALVTSKKARILRVNFEESTIDEIGTDNRYHHVTAQTPKVNFPA